MAAALRAHPPSAQPSERRRRLLREIAIRPLFRKMAARLGIDVTRAWGRGLEDMLLAGLERCAACAQPKGCQAWLARAGHALGTPPFCPNARLLEACRIMDPYAILPPVRGGARPAGTSDLAAMLADPLVRQVMRGARPKTVQLLTLLSGQAQRLVARAVGVI